MTRKSASAVAGFLLAALAIFATSPENKPNPIEAARLNNLGAAYMNQQLFEKALRSFQQAEYLDSKLTIARLNEGIAYLNLQKIDEARAALEDALKRDPKNPNAWYNLGLMAKNTGDAAGAIVAFQHVVEIDGNDADTWYFLGTAYVQAKQFPQAIDAFQHALQINPLHASAEFGLSRAYQQSTDIDHAREHLKKFQYITQNKIGSPISLAYGEQGQYSRAVESASAVLRAPAQIKVQFVDVTAKAGIVSRPRQDYAGNEAASLLGPGACFFDFDNDGKVDLLVADNGSQGGISLYHNLGDKFEEVTAKAGLDPRVRTVGCTAGDYDNDGFQDLAVSLYQYRIDLFHNQKNGTFENVAEAAGIKRTSEARSNGFNAGLAFIDYDHDGDLDLYVTKYGGGAFARGLLKPDTPISSTYPATEGSENRMWRNNGNATFTDVTEALGLTLSDPSFSAVGTDYNNDRAVDIVVTGGPAPAVFANPREGKFLRQEWPAKISTQTMGVAVLDFDHDGWMDFGGHPIGRAGAYPVAQQSRQEL